MSKPAIFLATVLLAGSVFTAPAVEAAPAPAPADSPASSVRVVVDADELGADAEAFFEKEAYASVRAALEQAGYTVTDQADADVTVRLRMSFYNADDLDYEIDVDISAGAELVRLETVPCPQCVDADVLGRVDVLGEDVAAGVARALAAVKDVEPPAGDGDGDPDPVAPVGAVGIIGGVVAGLGVGVTIAGAVELSRGKVYDTEPPTPDPTRTFVEHRPPGIVLISAGVVALTAGTAMLIADIVMRSKQRKQQRHGSVYPALGPGLVGLGYIQRF